GRVILRVVFMGTPEFSVPVLEALVTHHQVVSVYTQPDRIRGRGRTATPSPAKIAALANGIPVSEPETLRDPAVVDELRLLAPDVICVAAYGQILPMDVLLVPRFGCLNVHASLLPRHRGAAPVHRAILEGDVETGVVIMLMDEGLDTGPYTSVVRIPVDDHTVGSLTSVLATLGARALLETLDAVASGTVRWVLQDDSVATHAAKVAPADLELYPGLRVADALRRVRASTPSARSRACIGGTVVDIIRATAAPDATQTTPGSVISSRRELLLGLSDGAMRVEELRPAGKAVMDGACFGRGRDLGPMATWGSPL
ncbi:MAG: methionyl-tRNA formyltransferase, partial [Coriobacteriia bacterium]|nr:methionyl-tRNA formyltransferase [Coriobacteriia bacterium]